MSAPSIDTAVDQEQQSSPVRLADEFSPIVVAVIPAYNEERFIASVVFTAQHYVSHVVVVDDGSSDRTADLAQAAGAIVVRQVHNGGKARALNAGFLMAQIFKPDVIICLDGDAQHEPAEIPNLIRPILDGQADVVIGSRFLDLKSEIPKWRQVGQHTLTFVTNTLSGVRVTDSQSGFRAFSPGAAEALKFSTEGLSVESEMQFLFEPSKLRVTEVPISVKYLDGNKRNPVLHGLQVLNGVFNLITRGRPLLFISLPGLLLSSLGLLAGFFVILKIELTGELLAGTAMLTVLLIIGGLLLAATGIMLHSVGQLAERLRHELRSNLELARHISASEPAVNIRVGPSELTVLQQEPVSA